MRLLEMNIGAYGHVGLPNSHAAVVELESVGHWNRKPLTAQNKNMHSKRHDMTKNNKGRVFVLEVCTWCWPL